MKFCAISYWSNGTHAVPVEFREFATLEAAETWAETQPHGQEQDGQIFAVTVAEMLGTFGG